MNSLKSFKTDISSLSKDERGVLEKLTEAAEIISSLYEAQKNPKYPGANFYPHGVKREEIESAAKKNPAILHPYTFVERDAKGKLVAVPYSKKFSKELKQISKILTEAAVLSKDKAFRTYLNARAKDIMSENMDKSNALWLKAGDSKIGCVIGAFNRYHDTLFLKKRAYTFWVGVLDQEHTKEMKGFQDVILASQKKFLPGAKRTDVFKLGIRMEQTVASAGVDADFRFSADSIPTSVDLAVIKKHGMISTVFMPMVKWRFDTWIYPMAQAMFPDYAKTQEQEKEMFEAFLRITTFAEISHSTMRYDDIAARLDKFSVGLDEVYASILTIKNAGLLYLKSALQEKELQAIMLGEVCQALYYLRSADELPHLESFADGYTLLLDALLEGDALRDTGKGFQMDFQKAFFAVDELSHLFEYYLSLASRSDVENFSSQFNRKKTQAQFASYFK